VFGHPLISQLEDFASKIRHGLESLDWLSIREIIQTSYGRTWVMAV